MHNQYLEMYREDKEKLKTLVDQIKSLILSSDEGENEKLARVILQHENYIASLFQAVKVEPKFMREIDIEIMNGTLEILINVTFHEKNGIVLTDKFPSLLPELSYVLFTADT